MSDISIATAVGEGSRFVRRGGAVVPQPIRAFGRDEELIVYFELYGLQGDRAGRSYFSVTTEITGDAGSVGTSSQESVAFKEAGIKLKVTPIVQADGMVQLSIDQEFSEVIDRFLGIPILDTRKVVSQFLVQDTDTVVIGGLIQSKAVETDRGVPVLMHL